MFDKVDTKTKGARFNYRLTNFPIPAIHNNTDLCYQIDSSVGNEVVSGVSITLTMTFIK